MQDCKLPPFHGKLLHGALFTLMNKYSSELASFVHDKVTIKPFTVSQLLELDGIKNRYKFHNVKAGDIFSWRVTFLREELAEFILGMPVGIDIRIGHRLFRLEKVIADGASGTGVIDEMELISSALNIDDIRRISIHFLSPTSFRENEHDYLLPLPAMVFGSLADKWDSMAMPVDLSQVNVRQLASGINITEWRGGSVIVPINSAFSISGIKGKFVYDVRELEPDQRKIMLLLAQYGTIAGVGRMSGHGFGRIEVSFV